MFDLLINLPFEISQLSSTSYKPSEILTIDLHQQDTICAKEFPCALEYLCPVHFICLSRRGLLVVKGVEAWGQF